MISGYSVKFSAKYILSSNGKCKIIETYSEYDIENRIGEIQWFSDEKNVITFGVFNVSNPNSNTPGAQFIADLSKSGFTVRGTKSFYKP